MSDAAQSLGLTTNYAPFIELAKNEGRLFVDQPYDQYCERNHEAWRKLVERMKPRWKQFANPRFLEGISNLCLDPYKVPRLDDVNRFLAPLTGFQAKGVSGYVPAYVFFDCLRRREFPTTITVRDLADVDYLPEPDIFHDIAGHVPMHTDSAFAEALVKFGQCARLAAEIAQSRSRSAENTRRLCSVVRGMARFFWFTIEFGLMRAGNELKVYGSGLLSSYDEIAYSIESPLAQRYPIQLEWVLNQCFEIDHFQPLYFIVDSFDQLFDLVAELETWIGEGKLDNLAPGEPTISEADFESFLAA